MFNLADLLSRQNEEARKSDRTATLQTPPWQKGARVYRSSAQSVNSGVQTPITFDTVRWDTDGMWNVANPTYLTVQTNGYYFVSGHLAYEYNTTGRRCVFLRVNGAGVARYIGMVTVMPVTDLNADTRIFASTVWPFVAGDYIELVALQVSGGPLNVLAPPAATSPYTSELVMHRLV